MAAATMLAARQSKKLDSGQQGTYSVATLVNCRKFLEPSLDDRNVGESVKQSKANAPSDPTYLSHV
jgi:hypothetical protein